DKSQPNPSLPLQRWHAVHGPTGRITGKRQLFEDFTHAAQALLRWLPQERRNLDAVAGDQEEAFTTLAEAAQNTTIMRGFGNIIAIAAQKRTDLVEQVAAALGDSGNILEN